MTSITVAFTGVASVLEADFFPEIVLNPNASYCCALLDFTSYNSIPNIISGKNNEFTFKYTVRERKRDANGKETKNVANVTRQKTILLPTGAYEVEDILKYLKSELGDVRIILTYTINAASSTVQIEFDCIVDWIGGTLLNLIGFENTRNFEHKKKYSSDVIVKITNIDVIRIECDIITGSYMNGGICHTIHQFSHCKVRPGYKFIEVPQHLIYFPIKVNELRTIQLRIVDQNGDLIDFRGEQISCRIHIKQVGD